MIGLHNKHEGKWWDIEGITHEKKSGTIKFIHEINMETCPRSWGKPTLANNYEFQCMCNWNHTLKYETNKVRRCKSDMFMVFFKVYICCFFWPICGIWQGINPSMRSFGLSEIGFATKQMAMFAHRNKPQINGPKFYRFNFQVKFGSFFCQGARRLK
jgi:hypothetical protein